MFSRKYLAMITAFGHRGTATKAEAAAAQEIGRTLERLGYRVETQQFRTPRDTLYLGPAVVLGGFAVAAVAGQRWPWLGLIGCVLLLLPMVGELLGSPHLDFDLVLPTYRSQNVVARPVSASGPRRRIVVSAHYDTQRASALFHPALSPHLQRYFTVVYALLAVTLLLLGLHWAAPSLRWGDPLLLVVAVLLVINVLFLLFCRFSGGYINGANDNGTGVALVLALAERFAAAPPADTELWFLLTGAEEVGTRGMKHFMAHTDLDPATTMFVNLDNLGGGTLHYLLGEGMLAFRPYGASLTDLAAQMAADYPGQVKQRRNLLLPTDGLIPALAGFEAISFLAFAEDGSLPNYHWYTDTFENVDLALLDFAETFLTEYIRRLAGMPQQSETA